MKDTYCNRDSNYDIPFIDFFSQESKMYTTEISKHSYTTTKKDLFLFLDNKKFNDIDFILFFDHRGNDVWNDRSMTMQKGTKFEFSLVSNKFIKPLIVMTCYSTPYEYSEKLIDKYEKWIKEYLFKSKFTNEGNV